MELCITDGTGHTTITCDVPDATHTQEEVKAEFDRMIAANSMAIDVGPSETGSRRMREWDPDVENVRIISPFVGG